jgi:uncharacterized membrane protein HdeD (DUF308 family)
MVITNIYLRVIFGTFSILLGLVLLKIYSEKDKDTIWGYFYRIGENEYNRPNSGKNSDKIYVILGCLSIVAGLIAILFGFRMYMVGN